MEPSKVYFSDLHCTWNNTQLNKLATLIDKAGLGTIDFEDKYVAVKLHFGEWGNMAFLRHQYAKIVCDYIKERGGIPFLTDCNTLYAGMRNNAVGHLNAAYMNGYNPLSTGVQTIIGDGLRGLDERLVPVPEGKHVHEAKIGSVIVDADVIVSLTHFKGHIKAGFGGVLKNIGMGCGSKHGKMEMHSTDTPKIEEDLCIGCGACVKNCLSAGVSIVNKKAVINEDTCTGCGHCFAYCPKGAISCKWDEAEAVMSEKIAEYTWAVLHDKPSFHISFVQDVTPDCDCAPANDYPVVDNVGMFASFDPIALDEACADAVNALPIRENCEIGEHAHDENHGDIFRLIHPNVCWEAGQIRGEEIGLGTRQYEIVNI